jgi:hypothetical protein
MRAPSRRDYRPHGCYANRVRLDLQEKGGASPRLERALMLRFMVEIERVKTMKIVLSISVVTLLTSAPVALAKEGLVEMPMNLIDGTRAGEMPNVVAQGPIEDTHTSPPAASSKADPCGTVTDYMEVSGGLCIGHTFWTAYTKPLTQTQVNAIRSGVMGNMRDPQSAVFGKAGALLSSRGVVIICGFVNGKNGYGGYTGMTRYDGELVGDTFRNVEIGRYAEIGLCTHAKF